MKKNALVVFSGGLDSTTALYWAKQEYNQVAAVNFQYGSNHQEKECASAEKIAKQLDVPFYQIPMMFIRDFFKSELIGGEIPEGHYQAENMKSTVVPFRNGIMLSVAAGLANSLGYEVIVLANHGGDHFVYPDCREEFIEAMNNAIQAGTDYEVEVVSPFCNMSKADIVEEGDKLGVDFSQTYSCYKGGEKHCGKCGTCIERKEAFIEAGVKDPTEYE